MRTPVPRQGRISIAGGTIVPHPKTTAGELLETCRALGLILVADRKGGAVAKPMPRTWQR